MKRCEKCGKIIKDNSFRNLQAQVCRKDNFMNKRFFTKIILLLLILMMVSFSMYGCGKNKTGEAFISGFDKFLQENIELILEAAEIAELVEGSGEEQKVELSYSDEEECYLIEYNGTEIGRIELLDKANQKIEKEESEKMPLTELVIFGTFEPVFEVYLGGLLIDYFSDDLNGHQAIDEYLSLFASVHGGYQEENFEGKHGEYHFVIMQDASVLISFDEE